MPRGEFRLSYDCALPGRVEVPRTATRESLGTISLRSSSCFPLISGPRVANPVMFPPGRARLATNPFPTGSVSCPMTMGIVEVASLAARVASGPTVTMISTLRRTSSAASSGADQLSLGISVLDDNVFPLHVPKLAEPLPECLNAVPLVEWNIARNPIRGTFFGCCASAMTATASSTTTNRIDKTPAFFIAPTIRYVSRRWIRRKLRFTGRRRKVFGEWKDQIRHEIELIAWANLAGLTQGSVDLRPLIQLFRLEPAIHMNPTEAKVIA